MCVYMSVCVCVCVCVWVCLCMSECVCVCVCVFSPVAALTLCGRGRWRDAGGLSSSRPSGSHQLDSAAGTHTLPETPEREGDREREREREGGRDS